MATESSANANRLGEAEPLLRVVIVVVVSAAVVLVASASSVVVLVIEVAVTVVTVVVGVVKPEGITDRLSMARFARLAPTTARVVFAISPLKALDRRVSASSFTEEPEGTVTSAFTVSSSQIVTDPVVPSKSVTTDCCTPHAVAMSKANSSLRRA